MSSGWSEIILSRTQEVQVAAYAQPKRGSPGPVDHKEDH